MVDGLVVLGIEAQGTADGAIIKGGSLGAGHEQVDVQSHDDHRIAMAFAVASLRSSSKIVIHECDNVATSFPNFASLARSVGFQLIVED